MRLGLGPKCLVPLAGRAMLEWAIDGVLAADVQRVVIAAPPRATEAVVALVDARSDERVVVTPGASTRQGSVAAALALVEDDVVLVHDAARPLTPTLLFDAVRAAVVESGAGVVPALTPADTVKRVDASGTVLATLDRSRLAAVQTPQGFPAEALRGVYATAGMEHTDDAGLYAERGLPVLTIPGDPDAFKITTRADLARAERMLAPAVAARTGLGFDVHAFDAARPLRLGGLDWPGERGLAGHSDADVVCHALADAVLSVGGIGDLGSRFGTERPEEAGRPGVDFIRRAVALLATEAGLRPSSATVQVIGTRPRIGSRRDEIVATLSAALGAPVSVSGTTTDGLGFVGREEGIAVLATVSAVPLAPRR